MSDQLLGEGHFFGGAPSGTVSMAVFWKLVNPGPPLRRNIDVFSVAVLLLVLILLPLAAKAAPQSTTTSVTVAPNPATPGQVVTLTATVTTNGVPVTVGTVSFLSGKQVLATVQMVQLVGQTQGTATLKTRFAPGTFNLNAQYNANDDFGASQSGPQQLTITGTEPTITTLTDQTDGNNWDFTASVFGFGFPVPTGQVGFVDLTDGFNIGSIMLAGPGTSSFQPQQTFLVGSEPLGEAVGDFDGDGFADLAVANQPDNTISVLLGNGDGTFQPQQIYQVGSGPAFIAVADFNSDGIPDLAVTNFASGTVSVLLGKADGTFQPQQTFPVGAGPVGVATGDFNGDGLADLAVANTNDNTVSVLLGKGDGAFQPAQPLEVGQEPFGLAVADFNGDGIADIVVANFTDSTVSVLLGTGDGAFQPQQTYAVGQNPYWVATGDVNQDGIPDLAVANGSAGTVSVLLGTGDGTFQPQQAYPVGATPTSVVIADFNGDGISDLATANSGASTVSVLLGAGEGAFQPQQTYVTGLGPYAVAAADLNGDGVPDLAAPISGDATVSVLLGGTAITAQLNNVPIIGSGNHTVQSNYTPDSSSIYGASTSNSVMVPAGGKATPIITLTASPLVVNFGNNEYFTAQVQSPAGGTPTGTVTFVDGTTPLATVNLDANGQANYTNKTLVVGQHSVTATYNGDSNFNSATSAVVSVQVQTPFMLTGNNSGTVSPGGSTQFTAAVDAAWQNQPLIYAVMTCTPPAGTGITCSVTCPPSPSEPPGLTNLCVLTQMTGTVATVTVNTSGAARLIVPLHRGGERRVVATLMGLGGIGLVGLVFLPFKLRGKVVGGFLFLVIVVLTFSTSCGSNFAPGISSPPVNNTFYISVSAELREENPQISTGYNALGVQTFLYALLIK